MNNIFGKLNIRKNVGAEKIIYGSFHPAFKPLYYPKEPVKIIDRICLIDLQKKRIFSGT